MNLKIPVLLIDNNDSFTYNLVQLLEHSGAAVTVYSDNVISDQLLATFDHVLFSPGPSLPKDFPIMVDILNKRRATQKILGICLGHQCIAEYFGATLYNQPMVQHGIKKTVFKTKRVENGILRSLPDTFEVGLYHSWAVLPDQFPDILHVSCFSKDGIIMGIQHKTDSIEGLQFHPESIMTSHGLEIIKNWLLD